MLPYIILIFKIGVLSILDKSRCEKAVFLLFASVLVVSSAFRVGGTGTGDYDAYLRLYAEIVTWNDVVHPTVHVEIGFRLLSYIGNYFNFGGQYIIASMAFISAIVVSILIYRCSPYRVLSLLCWMPYFLTMNMQTSRTAVAAAFGLVCFIISTIERRSDVF